MIENTPSLEQHSFNVHVATVLDVQCGAIYNNILYWVRKNRANNDNFHEGRYWTYNSVDAFHRLMPYLTDNQIRRSLEKLEDAGFIVSGTFNKAGYDRTKWYSTEVQIDLANLPNGIGTNAEPIPNINTNKNTNEKTLIVQPSVDTIDIPDFDEWVDTMESESQQHEKSMQQHSDSNATELKKGSLVGFEDFWEAYGLKKSRKACETKWKGLSRDDKSKALEVVGDHNLITAHDGARYRPHPLTWLNQRRWEDDISQDLLRAGIRKTKTEYKKTELDEW